MNTEKAFYMSESQGTQYNLDGSVIITEVSSAIPVEDDETTVEDDESDDTTVDGDGEPSLEALQELTVALEWLRDVNYTISKKGVSRADMQALDRVRQRLVEHGVELTPAPSLENYAMAMYLEDRSGVNVHVATESFTATMVSTIRRWLTKLVDYVGAMTKWVIKEFIGEDIVKRKLTGKHNQILALQALRAKLVGINRPSSDVTAVMVEQGTLLLSDDNLRNNRFTVAAFGNSIEDKAFTQLVTDATVSVSEILTEVENLKSDLEGKTTQNSFNDSILTTLGIQVMDMEEFSKNQTKTNYVRSNLNTNLFSDKVPPHVIAVTPFDKVIQSYRSIYDDLRRVRKIDVVNGGGVEHTVGDLNELMRAIGNINRLTMYIKQYNNHKLQALRQRAAYETIYINRIYQDAKESKGDITVAAMKKAIDEVKKKINAFSADTV
jgi:hypothetical protein